MPQSRVALAESLSDTLASLQTARSLTNACALRMSASEKAHFAALVGAHRCPIWEFTATARFEGSMASIKIPFFQDRKTQFLRHGNLATPPEFRVNLGLIRCTDQGTVRTCPYSTLNRPSRSLHSTERRRRCLDFSPSAHHTRCPPWWSLCMVIEPY